MNKALAAPVAAVVVSLLASSAFGAQVITTLATGAVLRTVPGVTPVPTNLASVAIDAGGTAYTFANGGSAPAITKTTGLGTASPTTSSLITTSGLSGAGIGANPAAQLQYSSSTDSFIFYEVGSTAVYQATKAGTINSYVNTAALKTFSSGTSTGASPTITTVGVGPSGELYFYDNRTGSKRVGRTSGSNNTATVIDATTLSGIIGSANTLTAISITSSGLIILGNNVGELYSYNTSTSTKATLAVEAEIKSVAGGSTARFTSTTLFSAPNGLVYFYDNGTQISGAGAKNIIEINPLAATPKDTLRVVASDVDLINGPAGNTSVQGFGWYNNGLAYFATSGTPGLYAVPEPSALGLLLPAGLLAFRRNRRA